MSEVQNILEKNIKAHESEELADYTTKIIITGIPEATAEIEGIMLSKVTVNWFIHVVKLALIKDRMLIIEPDEYESLIGCLHRQKDLIQKNIESCLDFKRKEG